MTKNVCKAFLLDIPRLAFRNILMTSQILTRILTWDEEISISKQFKIKKWRVQGSEITRVESITLIEYLMFCLVCLRNLKVLNSFPAATPVNSAKSFNLNSSPLKISEPYGEVVPEHIKNLFHRFQSHLPRKQANKRGNPFYTKKIFWLKAARSS